MNLPDWLPAQAWSEYLKMRVRIKRPATEYAQQLAISKLERLRLDGEDVSAVLDQSTFNSWQGLFAVKKNQRDEADEITPAWVQFRACIRSNQMPDNPRLRSVIADYGGLNCLGARTMFELDRLRGDFDRLWKIAGAH